MNGEEEPTSEPDVRAKESSGAVFLPIGIVFLVLAIAMIFLGSTAWIGATGPPDPGKITEPAALRHAISN